MASRIASNGGNAAIVPILQEFEAFDELPLPVKRVVCDCGIKITAVEVLDRVKGLRIQGYDEIYIALWLENALKALTHRKYLKAGHPQFDPNAKISRVIR